MKPNNKIIICSCRGGRRSVSAQLFGWRVNELAEDEAGMRRRKKLCDKWEAKKKGKGETCLTSSERSRLTERRREGGGKRCQKRHTHLTKMKKPKSPNTKN